MVVGKIVIFKEYFVPTFAAKQPLFLHCSTVLYVLNICKVHTLLSIQYIQYCTKHKVCSVLYV